MSNIYIFGIISFLHNLCSAIWIGGLIALGLTVIPSIAKIMGKTPEAKKLLQQIKKRLSILVYISIFMLLVTGLLLSKHSTIYQGFSFSNTYTALLTVKHILYGLMIIIAVFRSLILDRLKLNQNLEQKLSVILLFTNIIFGVVVLFLSGFTTALAQAALAKH